MGAGRGRNRRANILVSRDNPYHFDSEKWQDFLGQTWPMISGLTLGEKYVPVYYNGKNISLADQGNILRLFLQELVNLEIITMPSNRKATNFYFRVEIENKESLKVYVLGGKSDKKEVFYTHKQGKSLSWLEHKIPNWLFNDFDLSTVLKQLPSLLERLYPVEKTSVKEANVDQASSLVF